MVPENNLSFHYIPKYPYALIILHFVLFLKQAQIKVALTWKVLAHL